MAGAAAQVLFLTAFAVAEVASAASVAPSSAHAMPPNLRNVTALARDFPDVLLQEIRASPLRAVAPVVAMPAHRGSGAALPVVAAHGMGDSCWEPGFHSITQGIARKTGGYARCIPTGGNIITDTINGYLMNMDKSVDVFAEKIKADANLANGFNAIGFSQGSSLIRGYIERYNSPPVKNFISVHGVVMGVAAFPNCFSQGKPLGLLCRALSEVLADLAYTGLVQEILFQANYFRDPVKVSGSAYLSHSQLAAWNNEDLARANATYTENFRSVERFAMVKAMQDTMIYPNEGEWWGSLPDGTYSEHALALNETKFYKANLFGLRDVEHKVFFESTPGDHMAFTDQEVYGWVEKYFMADSAARQVVV